MTHSQSRLTSKDLVIFSLKKRVAGTPYEGGVFRCTLKIDDEFPQKPPKGYFLTKIFHPNVSLAGEICVNTLKKDWDPTNWSLRHVFEVIRCLLIVPFPESSLNEEAGKMFMENYEEYAKSARVYCNVYAKKKIQSPVTAPSENQGMISSPPKQHAEKSEAAPAPETSKTAGKSDEVLGTLTLNPSSTEHKMSATKTGKSQPHPSIEKKKWMKRI